jgi:hypothetical protein
MVTVVRADQREIVSRSRQPAGHALDTGRRRAQIAAHQTVSSGRQAMSCCDETTARVPRFDLSRRSVLKGTALVASVVSAVRPTGTDAQGKRIKLAY